MLKEVSILTKKEVMDYFRSPLLYILSALFSGIIGLVFYNYLVSSGEMTNQTLTRSILLPTFGSMNFLLMFIVPLLTMGQFADEKKRGTLDLLLRSNLKSISIILGKFFSTLFVSSFLLGLTLIFPIILSFSGHSDWGIVFSNYLGIFFSICAYIAVGLFASTLTKNQIVAVIVTFCVLLSLLLLVNMANLTTNYLVGLIIQYFSLAFHHAHLGRGMIISYNIFYYMSFIGFFIFLTHRSLDSRNW